MRRLNQDPGGSEDPWQSFGDVFLTSVQPMTYVSWSCQVEANIGVRVQYMIPGSHMELARLAS